MKKYGIIAILLLVLTASGIGTAHFVIDGQQHDMTIVETTLSGDKREADGIFVKTRYEDSWSTVNWWTTYSMTENKVIDCHTDMEAEEEAEHNDNINMIPDFPYCGGITPRDIIEEISAVETGYGIPKEELSHVIESAESGKATHEEFKLKNYLDYLPVRFYQTQEIDSSYGASGQELSYNDYFQFPVPKGATAEFRITKTKDGTIKTWVMDWNSEHYTLEAVGDYDDEHLYFATSGISMPGEHGGKHILDMPEETHGIHVIPLLGSRNTYFAMIEEAKCPYHFEQNEQVLLLKQGLDSETLLVCTKQEKNIYLSVVDKETMRCRQKTLIMDNTAAIFDFIQGENFVMVIADNGKFVLLDKTSETYEPKLRGSVGSLPNDIKGCAADFDGERLAFASFLQYDKYERDTDPRYQLQVFDQSGLLYHGRFESSLTATDKRQGIHVSLFWQRPIEVSFDEIDDLGGETE